MRKLKVLLSALLLAVTTLAFAQDITVKGVVTDASTGEPLSGAAILVKGTPKGVVADENGRYTVTVPANGTLGFTTIGFKDLEVAVEGRNEINVKLVPDSELLEETIVIAYGTSTKNAFTGSASVVKSEEISRKITSNVTSALSGAAPGVQVLNSQGDPASNAPTIRIRGIGSMSASSAPLIVVDGVPYDGSISDINPQDVENISVLKDAASTAVYGHRGGNGVVIITTKKGQSRDAEVKVDMRWGSNSRLIPQYDVITDPAQYYETQFALLYNSYVYSGNYTAEQAYQTACANIYDKNNGGLGYRVFSYPEGQELIGRNLKLNPNATLGWSDGEYYYTPDDWYNETFHNSFRQEYNVSVAGSSDRINYYASVGLLNDGGIVDNSNYKRYTARINADYQAKKWLKLLVSMNYSYTDSAKPYYTDTYGSSGNLFYIANTMGAIYPLYVRNADGTIKKDNGRTVYDANQTNQGRPQIVGNAVRDNAYDRYHTIKDAINGKIGALITPVKGLTLSATITAMANNSRENDLYSKYADGSGVDGQAAVVHNRVNTINQDYMATYKFDIDKNHFDILAGYTQYNQNFRNMSGSNDHLFNPGIGELGNALGKSNRAVSSYDHKYMTQGFLARAQYDFGEKYFVSASFNRNASSRFSKTNRWGNFWSVGAGWVLSEEDFLKNADWVNFLKLKASYGVNGNDNFGSSSYYYYAYADQYSASYNEESGEYSTSMVYKGNENITWEKNGAFNVGVEFEFLNGYLNGGIDVFSRTTKDLLYSKEVPLSSGNPTSHLPINVGSINNTGFDIDLGGKIIANRNVNWKWNANLSHYTNKILSLDTDLPEEGIVGSNYIYKIGGSLYDAYMYKFAGVNKETGVAQYYYQTKDKDGNEVTAITENFSQASKYNLGSVLPKLYGGFGTSLTAYGFDFSIQFSYQLGGRYYDGQYQSLMFTQDQTGSAMHKDLLKAWTPENCNSNIPRLDGDYNVAQSAVDRFFISSNYLSLNNVTLGYTIPKRLTEKIKIASLRVYVAGENLAVVSARKGVDPRYSYGLGSFTSGSGLNAGAYSAMRNITGGVTFTF